MPGTNILAAGTNPTRARVLAVSRQIGVRSSLQSAAGPAGRTCGRAAPRGVMFSGAATRPVPATLRAASNPALGHMRVAGAPAITTVAGPQLAHLSCVYRQRLPGAVRHCGLLMGNNFPGTTRFGQMWVNRIAVSSPRWLCHRGIAARGYCNKAILSVDLYM